MLIEIYSDTVCPWCYVGLERLQAALAQRPSVSADVHWLPFELNPQMPAAGMDRKEYMLQRFGDAQKFESAHQPLRQLGEPLGIEFNFEAMGRAVNTRRSHALIAWAGALNRQTEVKRAVMRAYFSEGRDIGDVDVLCEIAHEQGLDADAARVAVDDSALHQAIEKLEAQALEWQVSGVPTFIFERRYAFSGAQEMPAFLEAIDAAQRA